MRKAFINALTEVAEKDKRVLLLTADLGHGVIENFQNKFPARFINMGVAEANMIAVAAGLSLSGKTPVTYSISTFTTMRCYEQIRNDVCLQNTKVVIVGVGGGLHYGAAGPTHHALEDIAIMRALPNMTVLCPSGPKEAYALTKLAVKYKGPVYLRLGKSGDKEIYNKTPKLKIGKGVVLRKGKDVCLFATGSMASTALLVSEALEKKGIKTAVINIHTIKPLDQKLILDFAKKTRNIYSLEEHHIIGGLGSAISEVLAESKLKNYNFKRIGIADIFCSIVGSQEYLQDKLSISPKKVVDFIIKDIKKT